MNADIGNRAARIVELYIKMYRPREDGSSKNAEEDRIQSIVAAVQLFSDISQTSLRAEASSFYPVSLKFLNITEIA